MEDQDFKFFLQLFHHIMPHVDLLYAKLQKKVIDSVYIQDSIQQDIQKISTSRHWTSAGASEEENSSGTSMVVDRLVVRCSPPWLQSVISVTGLLSTDNMASAFSLSWVTEFLRKVFILFRVDNHLSASAVVMGVVMRIFRSETVSEKTSSR
ncbi:hypothetical protein AOLI_G00315790 [Acnodon oligacanthus]